jgi:PAS domain S-box-containing protein
MSWLDFDPSTHGEMARRVREFDWSKTPLGPVENWSTSLKLTAATMLASGFPMAIRWGQELIFLYNDAYRPILGDKHPAALGQPLRVVWHEVYDKLGPINEGILHGERPAYFAENQLWQVRRGDGVEDARFTISYSPVPDDTAPRGIGGILTTCIDTTERVRIERSLRRLNETLEAQVAQRTRERDRIWQVSEDLLGVLDFHGHFLGINPAWTQLLGWSEDEIKRLHVDGLHHPADVAHSVAGRQRLAAGVPTVRIENRLRHKDGSWRWLAWTMTVEDGLIYVIGRHVTAEKEAAEALRRAEVQLAQSQKMEALGQLTGGIAHDFNNLLMVVSGNAQALKARLAMPQDRRTLEAIELAAARGESLTRQLLAFSRRQPLNPSVIDLGAAVTASRDLLSSSARGDIELAIDIPAETWPVAIDLSELELALVNLVVNARDAIPESGAITLGARNVQLQAADTADAVEGEFVALTVSDTGRGIAAEILSKVFEPFFTTKGPGKGTGLGLSQVYGFTRQSGGTVTIASEPGEGTAITLYLPRGEAAPRDRVEASPIVEAARANEKILLVEDNPEVGEVASLLLEQLGYGVTQVENAAAALEVLAAGEQIDLVFSDIVMPGEINGVALARLVRTTYPHIRVLLTTGYAEAASAAENDLPILRKPYRLNSLADAVRNVLEPRRLLDEPTPG